MQSINTATHTRLTALCPGDSEWQWHQLGHTQVCTSLQTDNHASTPPLKVFYRSDALPTTVPPNQQCQSTEGNEHSKTLKIYFTVDKHCSGVV